MWKYYTMVNCFEVEPNFDSLPAEIKAQAFAGGTGQAIEDVSKGMQNLPQAHGLIGEIVSHDLMRCGNTMIVTTLIRYPNS